MQMPQLREEINGGRKGDGLLSWTKEEVMPVDFPAKQKEHHTAGATVELCVEESIVIHMTGHNGKRWSGKLARRIIELDGYLTPRPNRWMLGR